MASTNPEVAVFAYGGYMNMEVLANLDARPAKCETAILYGYDLTIAPMANVARCDNGVVYGVLVWFTHDQLDRLYNNAKALSSVCTFRSLLQKKFLRYELMIQCRLALSTGSCNLSNNNRQLLAAGHVLHMSFDGEETTRQRLRREDL